MPQRGATCHCDAHIEQGQLTAAKRECANAMRLCGAADAALYVAKK
jgi:hypothetical protein